MNKSVLRTAIVVIIMILIAEYILKFFIPEEFVLVISNPNLIKFGMFIDTHQWAYFLYNGLTSFITYYLFTCACSRKKYLSWYWCLIIIGVYILTYVTQLITPQLITPLMICSMLILALLNKSNIKDYTIVFTVHTISQTLSLEIRNITQYIVSTNSVILTMLTLECYVWLILLYVLHSYNIKEREVNQ